MRMNYANRGRQIGIDVCNEFLDLNMLLRVDEFVYVCLRLFVCPKDLKPHFSVNFRWNFIFYVKRRTLTSSAIQLLFFSKKLSKIETKLNTL